MLNTAKSSFIEKAGKTKDVKNKTTATKNEIIQNKTKQKQKQNNKQKKNKKKTKKKLS